jgi:hypothetical protein
MKKIINILSIVLLTIATNSCVKNTPSPPTVDANGLPFATQTGANTFGCLIDGVPCSATGAYNWLYVSGIKYNLDYSGITIKIITKNPRRDFYLLCNFKSGLLGSHDANEYVIAGYSSLNIEGGTVGTSSYYTTIDSLPATITINKFSGDATTGAKDGDIVSGTLDMVMQNSNGQKVHITKGRFDISSVN